jgi:hypothetical protein
VNLAPRVRKAVLTLHIVSSGVWIGGDVLVAVLVCVGLGGGSDAVRGLALRALAEFVVAPMLLSALVCLGSGLLLGLATKWGLVRYWWVAVKLVMNVLLCVLIVVALWPGMADVGAAGVAVEGGQVPVADISFLVFPPTVSLTMLAVATLLSVYRPWGRVGGRSRRVTRVDAGRGVGASRARVTAGAATRTVAAQQRLP